MVSKNIKSTCKIAAREAVSLSALSYEIPDISIVIKKTDKNDILEIANIRNLMPVIGLLVEKDDALTIEVTSPDPNREELGIEVIEGWFKQNAQA